ncbi:MAG: DUF4350 domain-containing protein [Gammaproteobacteria bacterium]|nr:DUF4350 domain-containing protein [Gammaproteobacteria bacterium]
MKQSSVIVKYLLGFGLLALMAWALYASIEFYEETEESGWSVEALLNPYLAAQKFMTKSGIEVTDVDSLVKLDELTGLGTLFFSDANQVQTDRQLLQVMNWLEQGGNVIYTADSVSHDDDLLLREFAVSVDLREYDFEDGKEAEEKPLSETMREYNRQIEEGKSREEIAQSLGKDEQSITRVKFGDEIGELEIAFNDRKVLTQAYITDAESDSEYQPFSWSNSEHGIHMMQFEVGSGLLTIVSDPGIWTSYHIDQYDHAYLLWLLSSGEGNFAILHSVLHESLWTLMRQNAAELLLAAGLLILVWIWRTAYRFGRLLPRDLSQSRALGEHFSAVSHYLWHRHEGGYLVEPLRQRVLRRASLVLGDFSRSDEARQYELIAERCELFPEVIARAFSIDEFTEASFVKTVRLLKHIEQSL